MVENNDDLGRNEWDFKLVEKGAISNVVSFVHETTSKGLGCPTITPLAKIINDIERQMVDEKLVLVVDDWKPLKKVDDMINTDSDSKVEEVLNETAGNSEISLNVRDTENTLDDASKSQQKVYEKMNNPIAVANKQNCWTIDYAQIKALYKDFVPQKELSSEQKYFPSSFIPSDKNSNATPSILIKERDNVKLEYQKLFNSIKKTRSQTQTEMDELIAHVFEKTYAYGAIRAENQNLLFTITD
ncbi:hypothetical protein Tco_1411484 [Tanacetum coccineum]